MDISTQKKELLAWVGSLTEEVIIKDILAIKDKSEPDSDNEWTKTVSIKQARQRSKQIISELPWKK